MRNGTSARGLRTLRIVLEVLFVCCLAGGSFARPVRAQARTSLGGGIEDFRLLAPRKGWLLANNRLFWTEDNGDHWRDISPSGAQTQRIAAVFFADNSHAWVGLADTGDLLSTVILKRTADAGATWETLSFSVPTGASSIPLSGTVHMQWLDARSGWLLFEASTSSSFSAGRLFKTEDGGLTWAELASPVGESIYFASARNGWAVGRDGDGLYRTQDGGLSWNPVAIGDDVGGHVVRQYRLPAFDTPDNGLIPVLIRDSSGQRHELDLYSTADGGSSWSLLHRVALAPDIGTISRVPLDIVRSDQAVVVLPRTTQVLRMLSHGTTETLHNQDGMAQGITKLHMLDTRLGWGTWLSKGCRPMGGPGAADCTTESRLLSTVDGGAHWSSVSLPGGDSGMIQHAVTGLIQPKTPAPEMSQLSSTQIFAGQGFDSCVPPTLAEMQDWWSNSPYGVWNLYTGGSNRGCKEANQAAITVSFVSQLHQQGWRFIPTWVGLQAPCSTLNVYKMSRDPGTAYSQGVSDANAASETAADLGFSHTVLYFDLEYFSSADAGCLAAAQAFISGWTAQLHSRGNQAGVYGSACGSGLDNYYSIPNVPDAIWPAAWSTDEYDGFASVWGIPCIPDSHWNNHQRILQYAGDHGETWGVTSLNIDSDVLDGIVGSPSANCANPRPGSGQIGLYSDDNYCGAYTILDVGEYSDPSALGIANDSVSSIKVGAGAEAVLCRDAGYLGACEDFTANNWNLTDTGIGNDQVSSAKVVQRLALISPLSATHVLSLRPAFDWASIPGASLYSIQISRNSAFTDLVTNTTASSSAYTPLSDLPANRWLFWRARGQVASMWRGWSPAARFKTPNPPSVPGLISPANDVLTKYYKPRLDWGSSALPSGTAFDRYQLQVDDNQNFGSPAINVTTSVGDINASSYTPQSKLAPNTTFYWHVRAYNAAGEFSSWSARWSFRTALPPPMLAAPSNGMELPNKRPKFRWNPVAGATGYEIQVSGNQAFSQMLWNATPPKTSYTPPADLPASTRLFWRVGTRGTNGPSAWSSTWSFVTANPPSIPVLSGPVNDALVRTYRPRLDWQDSSVPAGTIFSHYQVQIAEDAGFHIMFLQADVDGDAAASELILPVGYRLAPNATYYWRVRAYNTALQYSAWSGAWKLRTVILPPSLVAPADGETVSAPMPLFDWEDVSGATQYTIQISGTSDFASIYLQASPTESQFTPAVGLPAGASYWRVKALGPNGPSKWSEVRMYVVQ